MSRPRSKTTHHIYERKGSPNWWMWWYDDAGGRRRNATRFPRAMYTREQACAELNRAADPNHKQLPETMTVHWLRGHILNRLELQNRSSGTIRNYRNAFDYLDAVVGAAAELTAVDRSVVWKIKEYGLNKVLKIKVNGGEKILKTGMKPETINTRLKYLHAAFNTLVKEDILEANPFRSFERLRERRDGPKHLTLDELKHFLEVVDAWPHEVGRRLVRMVIYTGLRRGEVLEIERGSIDLPRSRFNALNIKSRDKHKRWLPIHPQVREHFEWFLSTSRSSYPFRRCHPDTLSDWSKVLLVRAGFPDQSTKSLRHTFSTLSLEHGMPVRELQRYLDHSDLRITEIYTHDLPDDSRAPDIGI